VSPEHIRDSTAVFRKFLPDQPVQMFRYRWMIEALDDFVQKASHNETLGDRNGNAAGAQVQELVLVDLPRRRTMGATDVVGENFETRHRIGFCIIA
jgi:hypothetical protein